VVEQELSMLQALTFITSTKKKKRKKSERQEVLYAWKVSDTVAAQT
jgi:hypothetical protein